MNTDTDTLTPTTVPSAPSSHGSAPSTPSAPTSVIAAAFYEAFLADDLIAASALIAPDAVLHVPGSQPQAGDHEGIGAILDFVLANQATVGTGSVTTEVIDITGGATHATAICMVRGARPGRATMHNRTVHVLRIDAGRIAEIWFHNWDQAGVDAFWS